MLLLLNAVATAQPMPTTAPATVPASERGVSVQPVIDRLEAALSHVGLSADQKSKADALLAELRTQLRDLPNLAPEDRRDTYRQVMGDGRRKLAEILTPDQQKVLRDHQQVQARPAAQAPTPPPKVRPTAPPATPPVATDAIANKTPAPAATPAASDKPIDNADGPFTGAVGAAIPDFTLKRLPSGLVKSAAFANRVVVIEFGSYSAPPFRYRTIAMDALAKEYSGRAEFITIYTAEAYPAGEWDVARNRDDKVSIPRHPDEAARMSAAENMRAILKPLRAVAVDSLDDPVAVKFRAGAHSAFVIGRDGVIVARQQWCDPDGLRRHIDAATAQRVTPKP